MNPTPAQIRTIARHFILAAIWADCEEGTHPRPTKDAQAKAEAIAREFIAGCPDLFEAAMNADGYGSHTDAGSPEAAFGHDLYLTLNGHGVGFWDRGELQVEIPHPNRPGVLQSLGDALTDACHNCDLRSFGYLEFWHGWVYIRLPDPKP